MKWILSHKPMDVDRTIQIFVVTMEYLEYVRLYAQIIYAGNHHAHGKRNTKN